jgi:HSP20 family molecular chaperone IbpA
MTQDTKSMMVQDQEMIPAEETERLRERTTFVPRSDIYETAESFIVILDMPGVNGDTIDITLDKNLLLINGFTDLETPEGYTLAFAEYESGDFERSFRLTDKIDRDGIEAIFRDGVLHLTLPKAAEEQARKIVVQSG